MEGKEKNQKNSVLLKPTEDSELTGKIDMLIRKVIILGGLLDCFEDEFGL